MPRRLPRTDLALRKLDSLVYLFTCFAVRQVWCCALSNDNELAVSGSRDHTIRMWRVADGSPVAAIDAGVDVFRVLISNNKKTVVALADKFAARKLIMLQVTDYL